CSNRAASCNASLLPYFNFFLIRRDIRLKCFRVTTTEEYSCRIFLRSKEFSQGIISFVENTLILLYQIEFSNVLSTEWTILVWKILLTIRDPRTSTMTPQTIKVLRDRCLSGAVEIIQSLGQDL